MDKLRKISLNGLQLKLIGWVCTLCYVLGIVCFPIESSGLAKLLLFYGGCLSLPIFAFLLVEGFLHTRNLKWYLLRLLACAIITEPFYDYFCTGSWLSLMGSNGQNLFFAMVIGLVELYFLRYKGTSGGMNIVASCMMVLAACAWTFVLNIPYGILLVLFTGIFYLLREYKIKWVVAGVLGIIRVTPMLAVPMLMCYNGERGKYNKYLFIAAYPAIWVVAAVVKLILS